MAAVAAMLLRQRLATLHARGIAGVRGRRRLRHLGDEIGEGAEIVVGQRLRHLVHRLEGAQLLAKHEQLDQRVRRLLPTERGRVFGLGLALFAVTGEARRDALLEGFPQRRDEAIRANASAIIVLRIVLSRANAIPKEIGGSLARPDRCFTLTARRPSACRR